MATLTGEPSTTPERPDRRSSRERRAQQDRAKLDALRRQQRRKRFLLGGLGILALQRLRLASSWSFRARPPLRATRCPSKAPGSTSPPACPCSTATGRRPRAITMTSRPAMACSNTRFRSRIWSTRWVDEMDQPDAQRIVAFYRAHVDRGPEDAL
jgi:hypothetical protein